MRVREEPLTPVGDIQGELLERKPLPIGRTQFDEWSDRIIKAAGVEADITSMKAVLAGMLMTLGPTEAFKEDGYYALALRVDAIKTTAVCMRQELDEIRKAKFQQQATDTGPVLIPGQAAGILENQTV